MMTFSHLLLIFIISIPIIFASDDKSNTANVENLKILRNSVNFAFKMGNDFLDLIRGNTPTHEPVQNFIKKKDSLRLNDFIMVGTPFLGYIILVMIGLLFVFLMPIVGFCFCLCRCGGKCGGKVKGMDPKHATCKRYSYAVLLGIISIIMLAGIVLAFINNQLIHDTLTSQSGEINALTQINSGWVKINQSLQNISKEIDDAEKKSPNIETKIDKVDFVIDSSQNFVVFLQSSSSDVVKLSTKLENLNTFLIKVKKPNDSLKKIVTQLNDQIKIEQGKSNFEKLLQNFKKQFDDLKKLMKESNTEKSSTVTRLRNIVKQYEIYYKNLNGIKDSYHSIKSSFNEILEYRMYICIGVCCLLLLIVLFYFLGLCFGQCGERPFEDARICNRGVGANLMMAGVAFAFLFTPIIMIITIEFFVSGGMFQTEICRHLVNSNEPGIRSIDTLINLSLEKMKKSNQIDTIIEYDSDLLNIIIKCPHMPMVKAYNINTDLLTPSINEAIIVITEKVKERFKEIVNKYSEDIRTIINNIKIEMINLNTIVENFDDSTKTNIIALKNNLLPEIDSFNYMSFENKFMSFFNSSVPTSFGVTLTESVKSVFNEVFINPYDSVKCVGMHNSTKTIIDAVCVTLLWPVNGFWYGVGICLVFTIPAIIFAVKLAGLYRHTEKYSADYEEPDYHSYMGFYTNNADNIPMKKPKSGKGNQKNRNSNFNNKDSLKQTNPQYLPVYPYDAYE